MKKIFFCLTLLCLLIFAFLVVPSPVMAKMIFFDSFSNGLGDWTITNSTTGNSATTEFDNTDPQHGDLLKINYSGSGYIKLEKQLSVASGGRAEIDFYDYGNARAEATLFSIEKGVDYLGLGLDTNIFGQTYYYRNSSGEIDSGIQRTPGYHKFVLVTSVSGS